MRSAIFNAWSVGIIKIRNSSISSDHSVIFSVNGGITYLTYSQLVGAITNQYGSTSVCSAVTDANYVFYQNVCP